MNLSKIRDGKLIESVLDQLEGTLDVEPDDPEIVRRIGMATIKFLAECRLIMGLPPIEHDIPA